MPELLAHTVTGADPLLSSWESGTLLHAWQRVPTCPAPKITLGAEPQLSFRGGRHFARAVTARCWGECSMSGGLHWEGTLGAGAWLPQTSPPPVPCADLVLRPLTEIHRGREHSSMPSP